MLLRPVTAIEVAANASERFRSQYRSTEREYKFASGKTLGWTIDALNTSAHTPENIALIINKTWAYPQCSACGEYRHVVAQFKEDWGDEAWSVCQPCVQRMSNLLSQHPNASEVIE